MDAILQNLFYMLVISLLAMSTNYLSGIMMLKLTYEIELDTKHKVFNAILNSTMSDLVEFDKGKLLNNVENDASVFSNLFSDVLDMIIQTISLIVVFIFMIYINPLLTIITLVTFPLTGIIYIYAGKRTKDKEIDFKKQYDSYTVFLHESIYSMKTFSLFNASKKRSDAFKCRLKGLNDIRIEKFKIGQFSGIFTNSVAFIINSVTIITATLLIFYDTFTLGMLTAFNEYAETFKGILLFFSRFNATIQEISVSIKRINLILDNDNSKLNCVSKPCSIHGEISELRISNLSYNVENNIRILDDINFTFKKGNIYVIRGQSGSGKTTFFNIISNLITEYSGNIFINDIDTKTIENACLRNIISFITQDNYIFSMPIKDNINLYRGIADEKIKSVCKQLNLHDTIERLEDKYDTLIVENGLNFSGGETQRLCIARAMVSNPAVYLFDEITSAIDKENITEIIKIIEVIAKESIVIISSHQELDFSVPIIELTLVNQTFIIG